MSSVWHKLEQLGYYAYLVNPLIPRQSRVCRSYARDAHRHFEFLDKSQWWSKERLKAYQDEKLRSLIDHAYANVPYYRKVFDTNGIRPQDIRSSEDLAKLPVLTKKDIRSNFPDGIVSGDERENIDGIWTTGGSTGEPLKFLTDMRANNLAWAAYFRFFRWHNYEWGDRISIFFRPFSLRDTRPLLHRYLDRLKKGIVPNVKYYDGSKMTDSDLEWVVRDLRTNNTRVLRGYPSLLVRLAEYCREKKVSLGPKFITTTGETLYDRQRESLEKQFQCDVYDQYGCAEIMSVGFECERHSGFHVSSEHCVVEIVDEDRNILPPGSRGTLLITDLDNYRMPFIRYMNGDEGSLKAETCTCGRNLPLMDHVMGRECELIRGTNGQIAHGLFFVTLLQDARWFERFGVRDFEVVQRQKDRIEISIVSKDRPGVEERDTFMLLCRKYFGEMTVELRFVEDIPRTPAAKRRYTRYEVA